ncbi:MAG: adenylate/guanylate cyclase domain-containing protein [Alphaproteobacteria bacterium]
MRQEAVIFAADVAGYTAMMERDEEEAFARVATSISNLSDIITTKDGAIFSAAGDGVLARFASAPSALRAALQAQDSMVKANSSEPGTQEILFRMGLHMGEVVTQGDRVFGSVVNVAARLQHMAKPGDIIVSGSVHEAVRETTNCRFEFLGALEVRGVAQRVRCFRVLEQEHDRKPAFPALPEKPSIAVLPFANLSIDPEQEFFADGIVEDIINALSRIQFLFVIGRGSSFTYKNRVIPPYRIGQELGVRYLLNGTVRRAGGRMRITGSLIRAEDGAQIWSSQYEGDVTDIFALQDRVTEGVAAIIEPRLLFAEVERISREPPQSIVAHDLFLRATGHFYRLTQNDTEIAKDLTDRALRLDPDNARCLALGGRCRLFRKVQGWVKPDDPSIAEAAMMARRAAELEPNDSEVLWMAGIVLSLAGGDSSGGIALIDRALTINPNSSDALTYSGMARAYHGDSDVALAHLERAQRLSPRDAQTYNKLTAAAFATFTAARYEESLDWANRTLLEKPDYLPAWRIRAACLGLLDRIEEGNTAVSRLLALNPKETQTSTRIYYSVSIKKASAIDAIVTGLDRAGLPLDG